MENFVGKNALRYGLFSTDSRSVATNAAVIQVIALKGPHYLLELPKEVKEIAEHWPGINFPRTTSAYHERIQDLAGKAYIAKQERRDENGKKEKHPGLESYDWDLTYRGAVAAVTLPSVVNGLSDFMRWKRDGDLLRLPGLETISMFIQEEVAPDYWKHFVFEVTRHTLLSCDISDTSEDELYRIWDEAHTNQLTRIFAIIRSRDRNEFMKLKRLGWNEESARKYEKALTNNTEFRKKLQENAPRSPAFRSVFPGSNEKL